MKLILFVILL